MSEILVLSQSFGRWSPEPARLLEEGGLAVRRVPAGPPLTSAQVREHLRESVGLGTSPGDGPVQGLVVGLDEIDAAVVETAAGAGVQVLAKHGVGVDNIDVAAAAAAGIPVVNAPAMNAGAVADLVLGLVLGLLRRIPEAQDGLRGGQWPVLAGPELGELTVGIAGYGRIGRAVARRVAGFEAPIAAFDPFLAEDAFGTARRAVDLEELLATSDLVTLHLPGGQDRPVLDASALATMRRGSYLVNAARGDLVDEHAVAAALHDGHLAGYAADAFHDEPPRDSPVLTAPNTLLTPHMGAFSHAANRAMGTSLARSILDALAGRELEHAVHPTA